MKLLAFYSILITDSSYQIFMILFHQVVYFQIFLDFISISSFYSLFYLKLFKVKLIWFSLILFLGKVSALLFLIIFNAFGNQSKFYIIGSQKISKSDVLLFFYVNKVFLYLKIENAKFN